MGGKVDNFVLGALKALACCLVIAGVMAASADITDTNLGHTSIISIG